MQIKVAYNLMVENLKTIYEVGEAKSIARIVFEDAFQVYNTNRETDLDTLQIKRFEEISERLMTKEPVQYVLGEADFYGFKFKVDSRVLIPRQETEELVHWIIENASKTDPIRILDIGTGSACIPITLKSKLPHAEIHALDVSEAVLDLAKENAKLLGQDINFHTIDILKESQWETLPTFDIIVSNPPYIPTKESHLMPDWVKEHEPHLALFVDNNDPLLFYNKIAEFALIKLTDKGHLYFECNEFNASSVKALLEAKSFRNVALKTDINDKERMVMGAQTSA